MRYISFILRENDIFILKCTQYEELLHVRHSIFILGPAGAGKTACWQCLQQALTLLGDKCATSCLNPKAITSNELYGYFNPQSKEWRDGILSNIFRNFAVESKTKSNSKWIILDGIIDAEWIESMNTVMDDNKMLTLVSNERIVLTPSMRMIFEISHLKNASPATVSRAGVVFINDTDLGWIPYKDRWISLLKNERDKQLLDTFFDRYVTVIFDIWKRLYKPIVQLVDINIVQTICKLLEGILVNISTEMNKLTISQITDIYERYFAFATIWAFGGCLPSSDGRIDVRLQFNNMWRKEFPAMKISDSLTIFDYYIDTTNDYQWQPWNNLVQPYIENPAIPINQISVQTADTIRMNYIMSLLIDHGHPVMLVGTSGTGKTNLVMNKLRNLDKNEMISRVIAFNARTSSQGLQTMLEAPLEKRGGRVYGPVNRKKIIFFLDDINMPSPDKYGTQESIALLQQHINYGFWYERVKILQKDIVDVRYIAAMNPKNGNFTILDRVLRHFGVFCANMPEKNDLVKIYGQILQSHLQKFSHRDIRTNLSSLITNATINLHQNLVKNFVPTAIKFHYQWNMREMINIFQGLCKSQPTEHNTTTDIINLWLHECERTFKDRMVDQVDIVQYDALVSNIFSKSGFDIPLEDISSKLWAPFNVSSEGEENVYGCFEYSWINTFLEKKLNEYNELYPAMNLVLFKEAISHICRICRIISNSRGNALLVGVGGNGKQSLAKLASFILGYDVFQILVTSTYNILDFKADIQELYKKTGLKGQPYTFIISENQIVQLDMLVYINDMLMSGHIADLFTPDEKDAVVNSIMNEVKFNGYTDYSNPDTCMNFFIDKVRHYLHIVLCFSPLSSQFSSWCRQFPALSNATVIDWFHPWPEEALLSVAHRFLKEIDLENNEIRNKIAIFMSTCHHRMGLHAEDCYREEKRRCFTTPKSFLELIKTYDVLLEKKRRDINDTSHRLEMGIQKIIIAGEQISDLQKILETELMEVEEASKKTNNLTLHISKEKSIVEQQSTLAEIEEAKTNAIVAEVEVQAADCAKDLAAAKPIVEKALAALNTLDKTSLTELKAMTHPPDDVTMVAIAVRVLTVSPRFIPSMKNRTWQEAKKMMTNVTVWLKELIDFDCDNIPQQSIDSIQIYINNPAFNPTTIQSKSVAAAGLCAWVVGINAYHKIRCEVRPKEERLAEAQERLSISRAALKKIQNKVSDLKHRLSILLNEYNQAVEQATAIKEKANHTKEKEELAQRLVSGLSSESKRWNQLIHELSVRKGYLVGDVLLSSAFLSYIGPFSKAFRKRIIEQDWLPLIKSLNIPITDNIDPVMHILTNDAAVASWNNDGLPADRISTENGAITMNCNRWPLMIDPQLQGIKWILNKEEHNGLKVIQQGGKNWLTILEQCIEEGLPCVIENLGESIEAIFR